VALEPVDPVVLFGDRGHMWWVGDPALALDMIEDASDVECGYDGLARPLRLVGEAGDFSLVLASEEPQEADVRRRVRAYYDNFARVGGLEPPARGDVRAFLYAVADHLVEE
jgi:hypothetical protein